MKSRISFFNGTAFKKNITRFAPLWALYSVGLLMMMIIMSVDNDQYWFARNMAQTIGFFAFINWGYALLCAQLLFGDLYNSRMCNALHAMPLRRESWFVTNLLSGLAFSVVPNAVFTLISLPLTGNLVVIPFLWLGAVTLQYLFFFGAAVLAAYCVGNRFAMGLVYCIINFFSIIVYALIDSMFAPMLYGVAISAEAFYDFSPLVQMIANGEFLEIARDKVYESAYWYFGEGWGYLGICAALGIGCMGLSLIAYRKRNLECAGDFVAIGWLAPVFLILYTLCGGACCHAFFNLFFGEESYFFLLLGFAIGFFTGKMLLERTARVFRKKTLLGFVIFLLAFSLSFFAVAVDLFGIVRWMPKADRVESVKLYTGGSYDYYNNALTLTDPEQIADALTIHRYGIHNRRDASDGKRDVRVFLTYRMKDGTERTREYRINVDAEAGQLLKSYMSNPEAVLADIYTGLWKVDYVEIPDADISIKDPVLVQQLIEAVVADAREGNMAQDWSFTDPSEYQFWLELVSEHSNDTTTKYRSIRVSSNARHVITWLEQQGIYAENWDKFLEKMGVKE